MFMAYFVPLFYVPIYASQAAHTSSAMSFYLVSIMNAGSAVGRLGSSLVAQKFGASRVLFASVLASAVLPRHWRRSSFSVSSSAFFLAC